MAGQNKKGIKGFQSVEESGVHTGTEAWNIAQYFTGFSIALPLKDLNDLEDIARFGSVRMDEENLMSEDQVEKRRSDALKRYWQKLKQIVADTLMKVKKGDVERATEIGDWLRTIPKYFDALLSVKSNDVMHESSLSLNEDFFIKLLDRLVEAKQDYLSILDRTGLIFREIDDVDLDKMASEFVNGG